MCIRDSYLAVWQNNICLISDRYILIRPRVLRHDSRQEPYAAIPQVRICAGGVRQPASLPRPSSKPHFHKISTVRFGRENDGQVLNLSGLLHDKFHQHLDGRFEVLWLEDTLCQEETFKNRN